MRRVGILLAVLLAMSSALADDDGVPRRGASGLSVFASAGTIWADDGNSNFYSGRPGNANTIDRVLHSNSYGTRIWNDLKTAGLISSSVGSYNELMVVEYPDMYYRTSLQIGLGIRYDYESGFGWLLRFDLWRLQAIGAFNLSTETGAGIIGDRQYIRCGMLGKEDRINIDLALTRTVALGDNLCLELDLGLNLNNAKVRESLMEINGSTYSILDVWNGQSPDIGVGSYEYVNQGGLGLGVFMGGLVGYSIRGIGAVKAGYTCHHSKANLKGYDSWGWHHGLFVRFEINNFSFL